MSPRRPPTILQNMIRKTLLTVIAACCLTYIVDYLAFRIRLARNSGEIEAITEYDSAPLKNGKTVVFYDVPLPAMCVHALFPHLGYTPCWYTKDNSVKEN